MNMNMRTGDRNWGQEQEQVWEQEQGVLEFVKKVRSEGKGKLERKRQSAGSALRAEF